MNTRLSPFARQATDHEAAYSGGKKGCVSIVSLEFFALYNLYELMFFCVLSPRFFFFFLSAVHCKLPRDP